MSFPDTQKLVNEYMEAREQSGRMDGALLQRLQQYHQLCQTLEQQAKAEQDRTATASKEAETARAECVALADQVDALKRELDQTRAKLEQYEAHPDVKASRAAKIRAQMDALTKQLKAIEGN